MPGLWNPAFWASKGYEDEPYELPEANCIADSGKALLCQLSDGEEEWIPLSQIWIESEVETKGDFGVLSISPWLARKMGFLE